MAASSSAWASCWVAQGNAECAALAGVAVRDADLEEAGGLEVGLDAPHLALDVVELDVGPVERSGDLAAGGVAGGAAEGLAGAPLEAVAVDGAVEAAEAAAVDGVGELDADRRGDALEDFGIGNAPNSPGVETRERPVPLGSSPGGSRA